MVTPLEMLHAAQAEKARQQARAVQVYMPGRRLPVRQAPRQAAPRPVRNREERRAAGERGPGVDWSGFNERARNSPGAQKTREKAFNAEQAQVQEDETPWYRKGLGMVLGNPVVKTAMLPLNFIDTGRRAAVYATEKAGGLPDILQGPLSALVDEERVAADPRSFREKVLDLDSDYGYGQLLDPDNPALLNKALGFGGDVFLDPTSYVTAGATRLSGAAAKGAKLGEAATATSKASTFLDDAVRAAELGNFEDVAKASRLASEQEAMARRLEAAAAEIPGGRRVPLHQGRKGRASFIAELAEENPELIQRFKPELERAGERGFNTIRNPELREALGLGDPALRWMGMNIPGTERAVYRGAQAGGWARQAANKAPGLGPTMAKFAPKGLEEPLGTLTRGKGGDTLRAATAVRLQNLMRRGTGNMEGRGNKLLTDLVRSKEWRQAGKEGIRRITREAELDPSPNSLNKFFGEDIPKLYEEVAGRGMEVGRDKATYVPHMHTPEGRRFLHELDDETVKSMGFVKDDLLEGSKFLEKARKLAPDTPGVPKEFDIKGRGTITLTDGSIDEINEELARIFPEFKGKFYQDDPVKLGESYINSVARQAGRDFGVDRLAASGNPLVQDITGELLEAIEARNAWARSNPIVEKVKAGYTKGQRLVPTKGREPKPTSRFDPMLAETLHEVETKAQRDLMRKEGKTFVNDVAADVATTRKRLGENLKALRTTLQEGLQRKERQAVSDIRGVNTTLGKLADDIKALGPLSTENMDEMVVIQHSLELKKTATKAEIKKIRDRYGKKIPRDVKAIDKELVGTLDVLDQRLDEVRQQYARSSAGLRDEARKRKLELEAPLDEAEDQLKAAEAALRPRPVSQRSVQDANAFIRRSFESEDLFEAERARWLQALQELRASGRPIMRRVDGRLTPEAREEVRRIASQIEPPPPALAPEAPPAAAAAPLTPEEFRAQLGQRMSQEPPAAAPEPAAPPPAASAEQLAKNAQQLLKTARKSVKDAEKRFQEAATALSEASMLGTDPERIRKLDYAVHQMQARLDDARHTLAYAEQKELRATPVVAPEPAVVPEPEPVVEPPAPAAPAAPPAIDLTVKRRADGNFYTDYGFEILKDGKQWRIVLDGEEDFGLHPTIKAAKQEVNDLQEALISVSDEAVPEVVEEAVEEAVPEIAEEVVEEVAAPAAKATDPYHPRNVTVRQAEGNQWDVIDATSGEEIPRQRFKTKAEAERAMRTRQGVVKAALTRRSNKAKRIAREAPEAVEEVAAPAVTEKIASAVKPEPKSPVKRLTSKWTKKAGPGGDVEVGPHGWQVEKFEASVRQRFDPETGELVDIPGPGRGTRYVAINTQRERAISELNEAAAAAKKAKQPFTKTAADLDEAVGDVLRGRSWPSEREAKLAVEDALRRQRRKTTAAEVLERSAGRPAPPVTSRFEYLGSQIPRQPVTLTPEEQAANLAAIPPTRPAPPDRRPLGPEWAPTPEAARLAAESPPPPTIHPAEPGYVKAGEQTVEVPGTEMRSGKNQRVKVGGLYVEMPVGADPYWASYQAWQNELELSMSAATPAERAAAKRRATSMGGEFNEPTGRYHERWSAENVLMEDATWEAERARDPAWLKAKQNYDRKVVEIDNQTEAMVYVKAHDPILGQDVYTRTGSTAIGFGKGEERVPVLPKPPTEGNVPTGTRTLGYQEPTQPPYDPVTRMRDRALLDDPAVMGYMMPPNRARYQELMDRSDDINFRIHVADQNQANLDRLDQAAKAAYTTEVKAADEAVLDAKRVLERLRSEQAGEKAGPGVGTRVVEAERAVRAATEAQTAVRQQWMAADQAWRDALKMREEYLKTADQVSGVERVLISDSSKVGSTIVEKVRATREVPESVALPPHPDGRGAGAAKLSQDQRKWARELIIGLKELDEARGMGMEFMTDAERRRLTGEMVGIDAEKREMRHAVFQDVQLAKDILPRRSSVEEMQQLSRPEGFESARFGAEAPPPLKIPPVHGHEGLPGRAYAESFEQTMPGTKQVWQKTEEGVPVQVTKPGGRVPYEPRTEREAIAELQGEAAKIERKEAGTPAAEKLRLDEENIARERTAAIDLTERRKAEAELLGRVEKEDALSPLRDRIETLKLVDDALNDKKRLVPLREAAEAQRKTVMATKPTGKKADLVRVVDDLGKVAKQNTDLLDDDFAVTEAMLQSARSEAELLADKDLTVTQVQGALDGMTRKGNNDLDVMLVTTGKTWRMLREAPGGKTAVLSKGDTILDAELHKMFQNIYDISKDKVLFGRTINAFTNLFKTYATLTPGFHIRNALSAVFMNSADGVPLNTQRKAALMWREYMKAPDGEAWIKAQPQKIRDAMSATYGTGAGGRFTEAGFAEAMGEGGWADYVDRLQRNRFTRLSQRAGVRVEGSVRFAMAMHSMDIGDNIEAAIQRINRVHFDYGEISKLDENMKRLVPFWTFMSRNMPMQVSQMWTKPRVYEQYKSFVRNFGEENEEFTPEYWTKAGAFNTGLKVPGIVPESFGGGLPIYASPDLGFTRLQADLKDYEDFLSWKRPGAVLSQGNPLLTAPAELAFRQDIFTGQKFEEGETVPVGGINTPYKLLAGALGQTEGGEVDAAFMNFIRALNPLTDRSTRLAPQLTGGDAEGKKRQLESFLRTMGGVPIRTLTPKQQDNEYFRRYYDRLDAAKQQKERLQRQAG